MDATYIYGIGFSPHPCVIEITSGIATAAVYICSIHWCEPVLYAANVDPCDSGGIWTGTKVYVPGRLEDFPYHYSCNVDHMHIAVKILEHIQYGVKKTIQKRA